jgi:hypothetical protein
MCELLENDVNVMNVLLFGSIIKKCIEYIKSVFLRVKYPFFPPISPLLGIRPPPKGGRTSRLYRCYEVASSLVSAVLRLIRHLITNAAGKASLHKPIAMAHIGVIHANNGIWN